MNVKDKLIEKLAARRVEAYRSEILKKAVAAQIAKKVIPSGVTKARTLGKAITTRSLPTQIPVSPPKVGRLTRARAWSRRHLPNYTRLANRGYTKAQNLAAAAHRTGLLLPPTSGQILGAA